MIPDRQAGWLAVMSNRIHARYRRQKTAMTDSVTDVMTDSITDVMTDSVIDMMTDSVTDVMTNLGTGCRCDTAGD